MIVMMIEQLKNHDVVVLEDVLIRRRVKEEAVLEEEVLEEEVLEDVKIVYIY
jgi:hypothetical protein